MDDQNRVLKINCIVSILQEPPLHMRRISSLTRNDVIFFFFISFQLKPHAQNLYSVTNV